MNILPKKRWHVRTKDNIARVRRDEAEAREKEENRQQKLKFAESEARINFLRQQSGLPQRQSVPTTDPEPSSSKNSEHIDLFADFKTHVKTTNKELEKEQKEEREKYEKQIGYLTYLGQDTNEALKLRSWYEVAPKRSDNLQNSTSVTEKDMKTKFSQDPLTLINALLPKEKKSNGTAKTQTKRSTSLNFDRSATRADSPLSMTNVSEQSIHKKHKKEKKSKKHKNKDKKRKKDKRNNKRKELEIVQQQKREQIERLRKERLKREKAERCRQDELLNPQETIAVILEHEQKSNTAPRVVQKYNSQFNPELAKQNMG